MKIVLLLACVLTSQAFAYELVISPTEDRAYQRPAQSADISVSVRPTPPNYYTLSVSVDGKVLFAGASVAMGQVSLPSVDYDLGEHTVLAELKDDAGHVVATDRRLIYFIQNSTIAKHNRHQQASQEAFVRLPWYKRLYINLHQDSVRQGLMPRGQTNQIQTLPTAPMVQGTQAVR